VYATSYSRCFVGSGYWIVFAPAILRQLGQTSLSLSILSTLGAKVITNAKDCNETNQKDGKANSLEK
jgi:hypothetical protein